MKVWGTFDEVRKRLYLGQMILSISEELDKGNPTKRVWAPFGFKDEIETFWKEELAKATIEYKGQKTQLTPDHELYAQYTPEIVEDEKSTLPGLFTARDERKLYLRNYFIQLFRYSGRDESTLGIFDLNNEDALNAFYMVGEVLLPAFKKLQEEEKAEKEKSEEA